MENGTDDELDLRDVAMDDQTKIIEAIEQLKSEIVIRNNVRKDKKDVSTKFSFVQHLCILRYFQTVIDDPGVGKMAASQHVASVMFNKSQLGSFKSRSIRKWAESYIMLGKIQLSKQGKHSKICTVITDEDVQKKLKEFLRGMETNFRIPFNFMEALNNVLLREIPNAAPSVCVDTARRWMHFLGFHPVSHAKGYYVDGHERPDVVDHRTRFLATMLDIETRQGYWTGNDMEIFNEPELGDRQKRTVLIVHDECIVYSNDCTKIMWEEDGNKVLRPKSNGRSLHISGFCCACHGFLTSVEGKKTYKIIKPGKNADGYWTNEDLAKQFIQVCVLYMMCIVINVLTRN
jgi:hypothetical protein